MKINWLILVLFFIGIENANAQNRNSNWYFGEKAGLQFVAGLPVTLLNNDMSHVEGTATASDEFGYLDFYTNGIKVWNANHQVMPNGLDLFGNISTSQILIVPKPGDCLKYYVFVPPTQGDEGVFSYSEIDMTLQSGFGDVTQKNIFLKTGGTERVCATLHANNNDYWVVAQGTEENKFYSYKVTNTGIVNVPVVSSVGLLYNLNDRIGNIKFSPNGRKMVVTNTEGQKICQLFDFDNATGIVSNPIEILSEPTYGAEFSANGNVLYTASYEGYQVNQFNLQAGSAADIIASKIQLYANNTQKGGAMQLGSDGKIYLCSAGKAFLDAINNPNTIGTGCNFAQNVVNLQGRKGTAGLPNFLKSYSPSNNCGKLLVSFAQQGCGNNFTITLNATYGQAPHTYSIDGLNYQNSPIFTNQTSGPKTGYAKDALQVLKQVSFSLVENPNIEIKETTSSPNSFCGQKDGSIVIVAESATPPLQYSIDGLNYQTNGSFTGLRDSSYLISIKDNNGCTASKQIDIMALNQPKVYVGRDTFIFIGNEVVLNAIDVSNSNFNSFSWQPNYNLSNLFTKTTTALVDKDIEYTVTATNTQTRCIAKDSLKVKLVTDADIYIPNSFTPNRDGLNDVLRALPIGVPIFKYLTIYNRLGEIVFTTNNKNITWDGTKKGIAQNSGTYVFITEGIDYKGRLIYKKGFINLIR
jgi:gliding motility-associated-like protein